MSSINGTLDARELLQNSVQFPVCCDALRRCMKQSFQIALGILMAAAVIGAYRWVVVATAVSVATEELDQFAKSIQARSAEQRADAENRRLEEERRLRQAALEEERKLKRERYLHERRSAFDAEYVAPQGCENPSSTRALVECANQKMRAREEFFSRYDRAAATP